jgi:RNA polymerase sigma-70 factor (ECF subfamily)
LGVPATAEFTTTHWSIVLAAGDSGTPDSRDAMETLCRTYWYPLFAFARRNGSSPEDAKDRTQAFFERFLEKRYVKDVVKEKGRFRTFLLTAFRRFLCDELDRATAAKRGGGIPLIPLDASGAEAQVRQAIDTLESPELVFDRAWADTVVLVSVERLRGEYEAEGKVRLFDALKLYLSRPADRASSSATGQHLGMSAEAVAMAVMRLRRRYRDRVRAEIANTVATPAEVDDEMRYLVELLTR